MAMHIEKVREDGTDLKINWYQHSKSIYLLSPV